ncbi:MAG: acyl-CoA dehydrogenase family protein [Bacteroidota bacterium]
MKPQNKNQVLSNSFKSSSNLFKSDLILNHFIKKYVSKKGRQHCQKNWDRLGEQLACEIDELSLQADKHSPKLIKRNFYGEEINKIEFHPAYHRLTEIAIESEMFRVKWEPELRQKFSSETHQLGFVSNFLFAMGEIGLDCPLCMTDGVARLLDRHSEEQDKNRLLPHIYTENASEFFTGAMFLTEKAGGSDVGTNLVEAESIGNGYYHLNGEKWFCSNANAEIIFALARTSPETTGTKGLSIFLIEPNKPDGTKNYMDVIRLKDKLGVRSMASAEIILTDTVGKLIGKEGEGFKIMADMVNLSRLYNSVAALAGYRRALIEAYQFACHRPSFGKMAIEHALIRDKFFELASGYLGDFYMSWEAIRLLDQADAGDQRSSELLRILTPMLKRQTAENGVYAVRESMEVMGGIGYIEDGVIPKIMRDMMVLPIWEGAGNIMYLDMLRASFKSEGLKLLIEDTINNLSEVEYGDELKMRLKILNDSFFEAKDYAQEQLESTAKKIFGELTYIYQIALLKKYTDSQSKSWTIPAMEFLSKKVLKKDTLKDEPKTVSQIENLVGWKLKTPLR